MPALREMADTFSLQHQIDLLKKYFEAQHWHKIYNQSQTQISVCSLTVAD